MHFEGLGVSAEGTDPCEPICLQQRLVERGLVIALHDTGKSKAECMRNSMLCTLVAVLALPTVILWKPQANKAHRGYNTASSIVSGAC